MMMALSQPRGSLASTLNTKAFFDFDDGVFDVLLFSRSLHHIDPLPDVAAHVHKLLAPGGRIVVEDFSVAAPDKQTLLWFHGVENLLTSALQHAQPDKSLYDDPLEKWRHDHAGHHKIATREMMTETLQSSFHLKTE